MRGTASCWPCHQARGGAGVSACGDGAGLTPLFRRGDQTRAYGIVFDVSGDPVKLPPVTNPVIEGFILPKWTGLCLPEHAIGPRAVDAFQRIA